jgi:hypothetical protein
MPSLLLLPEDKIIRGTKLIKLNSNPNQAPNHVDELKLTREENTNIKINNK